MFDHLSVGVENLDRAAAFYDASLAPLGYVRLSQNARSVCYGPEGFTGEAPFAIIAFGTMRSLPVPVFTSPSSPRVATPSIASTERP